MNFSSAFYGALAFVCGLLVILLALSGSYLVTQNRIDANQRATQQQSQLFEQHLCHTLAALAALKPPSGNPAANPSRAYDDALHTQLAQLKPDIGCP